MSEKLERYQSANAPLPNEYLLWPLYGAGFEHMGRDGRPIVVPMPKYGPDELLVRHDACGLCFSDTKVIKAGEEHPRIYRDMKVEPVVLGHEVTLTVVGVGENLRGEYMIGDRFIVQADIYVHGVGLAYGYEIQGGLSQYGLIDHRVLEADDGNHLIPILPSAGYAESALTEPWTCVNTAYRLEYRSALKSDGIAWVIGAGTSAEQPYTISTGFDDAAHPDRLLLTDVPATFGNWLKMRAAELGVSVNDVDDVNAPPVDEVDDIILLGADPELVESASLHLADFGIMALVADAPLSRKVRVDVGRIHYNRWTFVGGRGPDISAAYSQTPVRSTLKPGGRVWFVGAGGPMGQMHLQRALQTSNGPRAIFCTARSDRRLGITAAQFQADADVKGVEFSAVSRTDNQAYSETLRRVGALGFDDIIVMAPSADAIAEAADYLAPGGVMNIFAGVPRGTTAELDLSKVYLENVRFIGHSGLTTQDMQITLQLVESGILSANRLVAAIGSLQASLKGLQAVSDAVFPGKIVIYPHIKDFPLTMLSDLQNTLPSVFSKLKDGREWTVEAEEEFLNLMLP